MDLSVKSFHVVVFSAMVVAGAEVRRQSEGFGSATLPSCGGTEAPSCLDFAPVQVSFTEPSWCIRDTS